MCKCVNVEMGSYDNQVMITDLPNHMLHYKWKSGGDPLSICVDACLAEEVKYLWSVGITTTGCCCGHNIAKDLPFIGVINSDIPMMKQMGYEVWFNQMKPGSEDSFIPKTTY